MSKTSGSQKIKVVVSDSTRMGCQLLSSVLKASRYKFSVVASATSSRDLLTSIEDNGPDVAVISSSLQDAPLSGLRIVREIHSAHPDMALIVLLDVSDRDQVIDGFRSGATGIFCRAKSPEDLCKCIHAVHHGQIWANSEELKFLLEAFKSAVPVRPSDAHGNRLLTRREEQVVTLVAEGLSNREISSELRLSEHTVKNYIFRVFNKLGISSRVELILYALNHSGTTAITNTSTPPLAMPGSQVSTKKTLPQFRASLDITDVLEH